MTKLTKFEEIKKHIEETFPDIEIEYSFDDKNKFCQGSFVHPNGVFFFSSKKTANGLILKEILKNLYL